MNFIRIKNWNDFQHYKHRNPTWIKLYGSILDNYEFACLQDASKLLLIHLWLLASKMANEIPDDVGWLNKKLQISFCDDDIKALITNGFVERYQDDSVLLATCYTRVEKSREEKSRVDNSMSDKSDTRVSSVRVLEYLNDKAQKAFRQSNTSLRPIVARLKELKGQPIKGYEDIAPEQWCFYVVDKKCAKWLGDPKMDMYLRPETLFGKTKFDSYIAEILTDLKREVNNVQHM